MAHTRTTLEGAEIDCVCPAEEDHVDIPNGSIVNVIDGVVQDEAGSLTDTVAERPDIITGMAEDDTTGE